MGLCQGAKETEEEPPLKPRQHFSIIHDSTNYNLGNVLLFVIPLYNIVQSRPVPLCCAINKEGFGCKDSPSKVTFGRPVLENVFVPPPTNFGQKVPPKARNREKADFATKVRKSSINHVNVNHEQ